MIIKSQNVACYKAKPDRGFPVSEYPHRHLILTAGDAKVGNFIADHWLRSINATCDLRDIDVAVLDYGFSDRQRARLTDAGAMNIACKKDMHIVSARFRDAAELLARNHYTNVLMTDGGDLIVQSDISPLLRQPRERISACREPLVFPFLAKYWAGGKQAGPHLRELQRRFSAEPMINMGVLVGPGSSFSAIWSCLRPHDDSRTHFGTDQLAISEYLLDNGYDQLDPRYNFIPTQRPFGIRVSRGRVFDPQGLVPVVHNAGTINLGRGFALFGLGPRHNFRKWVLLFLAKRYNLSYAKRQQRADMG